MKGDYPEAKRADDLWQDAGIVRQALSDRARDISLSVWWDKIFNVVAVTMLPFSTPNQLADLWKKAENPSCWPKFSLSQRDFITLLKAVDRRNASKMSRTAINTYFLAVGMLGDLSPWGKNRKRMHYGNNIDRDWIRKTRNPY